MLCSCQKAEADAAIRITDCSTDRLIATMQWLVVEDKDFDSESVKIEILGLFPKLEAVDKVWDSLFTAVRLFLQICGTYIVVLSPHESHF